MDVHDEDEVTREPFEDQNAPEEDEYEQDVLVRQPWQQPKYDSRVALDGEDGDDNEQPPRRVHMSSIEQRDVQEREDDDLSSVDQDDIRFAKSFGIQLPSSKSQVAAYQRLMNSEYIARGQTSRSPSLSFKEGPRIETSLTSDCIYHEGTFYQKGDIVALCDQDDGQLYFAQLTGFLQDQYCEKSATINWLIPIRPTSRDHFDPQAYRIGLEDVQLRKLDCMTFVRHCPHDYYVRKFFLATDELMSSENRSAVRPDRGSYIWTSLDVCKAPVIQSGEMN